MTDIIEHDHPYTGSDDIVGFSSETTGQMRVETGWFGRKKIVIEVRNYVIIDEGSRHYVELHRYLQSTEWIRV